MLAHGLGLTWNKASAKVVSAESCRLRDLAVGQTNFAVFTQHVLGDLPACRSARGAVAK
jgi:hypothetical protein